MKEFYLECFGILFLLLYLNGLVIGVLLEDKLVVLLKLLIMLLDWLIKLCNILNCKISLDRL